MGTLASHTMELPSACLPGPPGVAHARRVASTASAAAVVTVSEAPCDHTAGVDTGRSPHAAAGGEQRACLTRLLSTAEAGRGDRDQGYRAGHCGRSLGGELARPRGSSPAPPAPPPLTAASSPTGPAVPGRTALGEPHAGGGPPPGHSECGAEWHPTAPPRPGEPCPEPQLFLSSSGR